MKDIKTMAMMMVALCMCLSPLAFGQEATPLRIPASEAKNHVGQNATVCGKVVDTKVSKYGLAGHGKPVTFDLDQPEPNPIFFFIAFGTAPEGPSEVITAYNEKQVCVAGKLPLRQPADRHSSWPQIAPRLSLTRHRLRPNGTQNSSISFHQ